MTSGVPSALADSESASGGCSDRPFDTPLAECAPIP